MTNLATFTTTAAAILCATAAFSADYKVKRTLELTAPPAEVWHLIGDFCDIDDWHPNVSACTLKTMDGSLVRVLTMTTGETVTQKRIAQEAGLSYTYRTVLSPLPIEKFTATVSVEPMEHPLIEWSANFTSDDPAMEQRVVDEIEAGMAAIERRFANR